MTLSISLIIISILALVVGFLEGKYWQKVTNSIIILGIICYIFKIFSMPAKQAIIGSVIILAISIVLAIYESLSNAR